MTAARSHGKDLGLMNVRVPSVIDRSYSCVVSALAR